MSALAAELRRLIAQEGPLSVERYMALCLGHPVYGYYMTRDPFGAGGDFTTAPEISQMFGELLGLWAAETWMALGRPAELRLVELGPGRGTLMADVLRAARVAPDFLKAASLHLVETSPALRRRQEETFQAAPLPSTLQVHWHDQLAQVPEGPAIVIANEFLDALPIRQYVRDETGWRERLVGVGPGAKLAFGLAAEPEPALKAPGRPGDVLEVPTAAIALARSLAERLASQGGAALIVDYGHLRSGFGDTLQAVRGHAFADPLGTPGEADLTAHVDFAQVGRAAELSGARVHGPITQGMLLRALGIDARAAQLKMRATPSQRKAIIAGHERLTDESGPTGMGQLFKAVALSHPDLDALPGFPAAVAPASAPEQPGGEEA